MVKNYNFTKKKSRVSCAPTLLASATVCGWQCSSIFWSPIVHLDLTRVLKRTLKNNFVRREIFWEEKIFFSTRVGKMACYNFLCSQAFIQIIWVSVARGMAGDTSNWEIIMTMLVYPKRGARSVWIASLGHAPCPRGHVRPASLRLRRLARDALTQRKWIHDMGQAHKHERANNLYN
jgi:hypothetical protein